MEIVRKKQLKIVIRLNRYNRYIKLSIIKDKILETQVNTITTTAVTATITTTSVSISVLWENPIFIIIGIISGLIGAWNAYVFMDKNNISIKSVSGMDNILAGMFIGAISAPILNIALILFGEFILKNKFGFVVEPNNEIYLYALWFLISLFSARKIGNKAMKKLKGKKDE